MKYKDDQLTAVQVRNLIHYDPNTGSITWKYTGSKRVAGKPVGSFNKVNGYTSAQIYGHGYYLQRLIWLYVYGELPIYGVRFRDGDKSNFKLDNLYLYVPTDKSKKLTQARLQELIEYIPETGETFWRVTTGKMTAGSDAGCEHSTNRRYIHVDGRSYMAHRLIWLYVHGYLPKDCIDHINGNSLDNRLVNLREATPAENSQNKTRAAANNTCGYLGVAYKTRKKKYTAQITVGGKRYHLGTFTDPQEAHEAYLKAKKDLHPFSTL